MTSRVNQSSNIKIPPNETEIINFFAAHLKYTYRKEIAFKRNQILSNFKRNVHHTEDVYITKYHPIKSCNACIKYLPT